MYLRGCCNVIQDLQYIDELDIPSNLRLIASKLPYKLRERWRTTAYDTQQRTGRRVKFHHLVEFKLKMLLEPLFGDIQDHTTAKKIIPRYRTELKASTSKNSSFATSVAVNTENTECTATFISCGFCHGKHALTDCSQFKIIIILWSHRDEERPSSGETVGSNLYLPC